MYQSCMTVLADRLQISEAYYQGRTVAWCTEVYASFVLGFNNEAVMV